jgi:hypothetical protein
MTATLVSVDTRTGYGTKLGRSTRMNFGFGPNVVFSPSGQWIAYLEPPPSRDGSVSYSGTVRVVDSRNATYALNSAGIASNPYFASEEVLLFVKDGRSYMNVDVRAHALGGGDTSRLVAQDVGFDGRYEGHVSSDGQWILAPVSPVPHDLRTPDALSAHSLDGREIALANDVYPFWGSEVLWYSYAFAADDRHVVYMNLTPSSRGVSVVGRAGGPSRVLSRESDFVVPPAGNLVALREDRSQPIRLRLTNLDTTQDVAVAELTATPSAVTFTPDGASVVFAEQAQGSQRARLRHLSSRTGLTTDLAQWTATQMPPYEPCCNQPGPGYPIDPTGCFTVVDSDLTGGTSLILLPE